MIFVLALSLFAGRLSGASEEGVDRYGAAVVQGAVQDPSPVCARKAEGACVYCFGAAAQFARAAQGAASASWGHTGNRSRHMVAELPRLDDES